MQAIALSEPTSRGGAGDYTDFASAASSHKSGGSHNSNPFAGVSDSYNKSNFQEHDEDDEGMVGV